MINSGIRTTADALIIATFHLTKAGFCDIINHAYSEGYRSGHNEAVLKTVCLHGRVGSNPTPSAKKSKSKDLDFFICAAGTTSFAFNARNII